MNSLKQNRAASFVIVALIYILAAVCATNIYNSLAFDWQINLLIADAAATVLTFMFSVILKNASVYDPYWSVQPIFILTAFAVGKELTALCLLLLIAVVLWGTRLTANWAYTFKDLTHEDWRYTMLREKTGIFYPFINFIGIHMVPTLVVYGCTLPAVYAFLHEGKLNAGSIFFFCLSIAAIIIQGTADYELHRYQRHRTSVFIRDGLWKYSRHPNYLGEILMWWGIALSVISVFPGAWYLASGALANTVLFLAVSIPLADGKQSRKEGFAKYKRQTRMLLPIKK